MKKLLTEEKIHILLRAILAALVVTVIAYAGLQSWNNHKLEKQKRVQAERQQEMELLAKREQELLEKELKEKTRDGEIAALRQQILDLQGKSASEKAARDAESAGFKNVLANIVKEWSPRVAHIECSWFDVNGKLSSKASGSATIVNFSNVGIRAVTSKHLFFDTKDRSPSECKVDLLSGTSYKIPVTNSNVILGKDQDWAYVTLPQELPLINLTKQKVKVCNNVNAGDELILLGYPRIGATTGLTVTEGIVSGFDEVNYITSAKIDKGNSGGAAILVKDDCYLGIPASARIGVIESLGRILKASFVISN